MLQLPCLQEIVTAVFCKYAFSCACQSLRKQGWTGRVIRPCAPHEAWPVFPIPSSTYMHIDLASTTSRHVALVPSVWCASPVAMYQHGAATALSHIPTHTLAEAPVTGYQAHTCTRPQPPGQAACTGDARVALAVPGTRNWCCWTACDTNSWKVVSTGYKTVPIPPKEKLEQSIGTQAKPAWLQDATSMRWCTAIRVPQRTLSCELGTGLL